MVKADFVANGQIVTSRTDHIYSMLNQDLDIYRLATQFQGRGRIRIPELLKSGHAQALRQCLDQDVPWTLAYRSEGKSQTLSHQEYAAMDPAEREALRQHSLQDAQSGFSFFYDSYMMIPAYLEKRDPDLLLHRMVEFLNSPILIDFVQRVTGDNRIRKSDVQATCYRAGHFLTTHTDMHEEDGRLYAFVLSLTESWQADWGGLLMFLDDGGRVTDSFVPAFNNLAIFAVPVAHNVSLVMPQVTEGRYSLTGWFRK